MITVPIRYRDPKAATKITLPIGKGDHVALHDMISVAAAHTYSRTRTRPIMYPSGT